MAGNEDSVLSFIFDNCLNKIGAELPILGPITEIGIPGLSRLLMINEKKDLRENATEDSGKKADFYLNGRGISYKQAGGSFAFNRMQRKHLVTFLDSTLKIPDYIDVIKSLDMIVSNHHQGHGSGTFDPISVLGTRENVRQVIRYLMLVGSPSVVSKWPAELILSAPPVITHVGDIDVFTFDDYFAKFESKLKFRFRRSWFGQDSQTEHGRAAAMMKDPENRPWWWHNVSGSPNAWDASIPEDQRKTVYYLMLEKKP